MGKRLIVLCVLLACARVACAQLVGRPLQGQWQMPYNPIELE